MSRGRVRGLSRLILILVVVAAGCTSGGNSSQRTQAEIDAVLDSVFTASSSGDLSQLERFLDDHVAFSLSERELTPVPREVVMQILQSYVDKLLESADPSSDPALGKGVSPAFLEHKHGPMERNQTWVRGLLYIVDTAFDAEIWLRKLPGGDWKINGLRLLAKPVLDPALRGSVVGKWRGNWKRSGFGGDEFLQITITETADGRLSAEVFIDNNACFKSGTFNVYFEPYLVLREGEKSFEAHIQSSDWALSGHFFFYDCVGTARGTDWGFFEVIKLDP